MRRMQFSSGSVEVVTCRGCGKRTLSGIDGNLDLDLCRDCTDDSSAENMHSDHGHDESVASGYLWISGCDECKLIDQK